MSTQMSHVSSCCVMRDFIVVCVLLPLEECWSDCSQTELEQPHGRISGGSQLPPHSSFVSQPFFEKGPNLTPDPFYLSRAHLFLSETNMLLYTHVGVQNQLRNPGAKKP